MLFFTKDDFPDVSADYKEGRKNGYDEGYRQGKEDTSAHYMNKYAKNVFNGNAKTIEAEMKKYEILEDKYKILEDKYNEFKNKLSFKKLISLFLKKLKEKINENNKI